MNKLIKYFGIAIVLIAILSAVGCGSVEVGHVGVKVNSYSDDKGVERKTYSTGRYLINPFTEKFYNFPTFSQNEVWTQDEREGSELDQSFSFSDMGGMVISADVGMTYAVQADKVPVLFQKYRRGIEEITDTYLRNMVRDELNDIASHLDVAQIYGVERSKIMDQVRVNVNAKVEEYGIVIEEMYWIGALRLPDSVIRAIDAKNTAAQMVAQLENEVKQKEASARKAIAEATGEAGSIKLRADAEAYSIQTVARALRENKDLLTLEAIKRWDGKLPQYMGGNGPIPFVDVATKK